MALGSSNSPHLEALVFLGAQQLEALLSQFKTIKMLDEFKGLKGPMGSQKIETPSF